MSNIEIELPDGSKMSYERGTTVEEVAYSIGEGLGNDCKAGRVDGELVAKEHEINDDCSLEIVTPFSEDYLKVLRHTASHVLAHAIRRIFPESDLAMGKWADNERFFHDFDNIDIDKSDFERIKEEMEDIIESDYEIKKEVMTVDEAREVLSDQPYKLELLNEFADNDEKISFYRQGDFKTLCKGPHLDSTGEVEAFKLLSISGAYWRGDENNKMLTRIYGTAFRDQKGLEQFLERMKKAKERDHRKIGKEMGIFQINELAGSGLPLFGPNGKILIDELRGYMHEINERLDHDQVQTPHVYRTELWKKSGHYENYKDDMFLMEVDEEEYGMKPMNCPGHCLIYKNQARSYRDLPVRYAEDGTVYRREQKGELSGLFRVWGFTQDDAHLFVRPDQIEEEAKKLLDAAIEILENFGMDYEVKLATKNPEKYMGSDEIWEKSESMLKDVLDGSQVEWEVEPEDAAFYGPKIDIQMIDALGRGWDGPTIQLDFNMPEAFDLTYKGEDNDEHRCVMIHRALLGSYDRFLGVLIEHFGGNFPSWLAPEQVRILPISDDQIGYAEEVKEKLSDFRVEIEDRSWTLGKKIQAAHDDRVPYMLIVGGNEAEEGTVSVRDRNENEMKGLSVEDFRERLEEEVSGKSTELSVID